MFLATLAAFALAASSAVSPAHAGSMHKPMDTRITVTLANASDSFRDLTIGGKNYELPAHGRLMVTAPAGTAIYADSNTAQYKRGALMMELAPEQNNRTVEVR